jgi:hypothetical protein
VTSFTRLELATLFLQPALELPACHSDMMQQICCAVNGSGGAQMGTRIGGYRNSMLGCRRLGRDGADPATARASRFSRPISSRHGSG